MLTCCSLFVHSNSHNLVANDPNNDPALNSGLKEGAFGGKPGPAVVNTESLEEPASTYNTSYD